MYASSKGGENWKDYYLVILYLPVKKDTLFKTKSEPCDFYDEETSFSA